MKNPANLCPRMPRRAPLTLALLAMGGLGLAPIGLAQDRAHTGASTLHSASDPAQPGVQDLANRWTAAYNSADSAALAALYADSAELHVHNEGRFIGREAIRDYWIGDLARSNPLTVLHVTDAVVDSEMMLVHGNYQVLDRVDGVPLGAGRFAHIWVSNAEGAWTLDRDVWVDTGVR